MPKPGQVADVQKVMKGCKKDLACREGCENLFTAGGGTITIQQGGKVFEDKDGGKVFIEDPK